jgi:hypothetical protein
MIELDFETKKKAIFSQKEAIFEPHRHRICQVLYKECNAGFLARDRSIGQSVLKNSK